MKNEKGFSLVELLIVVAIIAIIAAIAIPSLLTSKMAANEAAAMQGCRTLGSAEIAYAAVNNQSYAPMATLVSGNFLDSRFVSGGNGFNGYKYTEDQTLTGCASSGAVADGKFGVLAEPITADASGRYKYGLGPDQVVRYEGVAGSATAPVGLADGDPIGKAAAAGGGGGS